MTCKLIKILDTDLTLKPNKINYVDNITYDIPEYGFKAVNPVKNDYYIVNPVGFTSTPDKNDLAYAFKTELGHKFCITSDIYDKPDTQPNEVCVGNFKTNNYVRINDNEIKIEQPSTKNIVVNSSEKTSIKTNSVLELLSDGTLLIKSPKIKIEGDLEIVGNITLSGNITINGTLTCPTGLLCNGKVINDTHIHSGVIPGQGNTGPIL